MSLNPPVSIMLISIYIWICKLWKIIQRLMHLMRLWRTLQALDKCLPHCIWHSCSSRPSELYDMHIWIGSDRIDSPINSDDSHLVSHCTVVRVCVCVCECWLCANIYRRWSTSHVLWPLSVMVINIISCCFIVFEPLWRKTYDLSICICCPFFFLSWMSRGLYMCLRVCGDE